MVDHRPGDALRLEWSAGKKLPAMESWSTVVMSDGRLSKGAIHVAWALTYAFNSEDCRCWSKKATLSQKTGLSESYVKAALNELEKCGHIIRRTERRRATPIRYIYPTLSRSIDRETPKKRRGGVPKSALPTNIGGPEPQSDFGGYRTEVQAGEGPEPQAPKRTEVQAPCILESSLTNPRRVQGGTTGDASREASNGFRKEDSVGANFTNWDWDDEDGFLDDEIFPGAPVPAKAE